MSKPMKLTERKHVDIINAATHEFKVSGYKCTSMDRIAHRAKVSKRTVYNHFSSKEELFTAIVEQLWEQSMQATRYVYSPDIPIRIQLTELARLDVEIHFSPEFSGLIRTVFSEFIRMPEMARQMVDSMKERESNLSLWIKQAAQDGKLVVANPLTATAQFLALVKSRLFWEGLFGVERPSEEFITEQIDSAVSVFLAYYQA